MAGLTGNVISTVVELIIAGSLLTASGFAAYYAAANYTGITSIIMPLVPLMAGLVVLNHVAKKAGFNIF